jgi:asparagine synthase (glutamine-hydrolysing)
MPGIYGFFTNNGVIEERQLTAMATALQTEDTSISQRWYDPKKQGGMGREALPAFALDPQPIRLDADQVCFVHGELIFPRIKHTQEENENTPDFHEVIEENYSKHGIEALIKANGGIASAIWNPALKQLILSPDRYGLRPLFVAEKNGQIAFSTEIKAILALPWVDKQLRQDAAMEVLAMDVILGDRTLIEGIRRIPFGSYLVWQAGASQLYTCCPMTYEADGSSACHADCLEAFQALTNQAVSARLESEDSSLALSGGLDSRFLLASAIASGFSPVTVTYGLPGSCDLIRAGQISSLAKVANRPLILEPNYPASFFQITSQRCEGLHNVFNCHGQALLLTRKEKSVVMLSNGVDQLLYATRSEFPALMNEIDDEHVRSAFFINRNRYVTKSCWQDLFNPTWLNLVKGIPEQRYYEGLNTFRHLQLDDQLDSFMLEYYANRSLAGLAMITHAMEFSEPFYDRDLVEFSLRMNAERRWGRILEKDCLRGINPVFARFEGGPDNQKSTHKKIKETFDYQFKRCLVKFGLLPPVARKHPSATFTDMHRLLRNPENSVWLRNTLLAPRSLERGIFQPAALTNMVEDHLAGKCNHTAALSTMVTLELFICDFLD